MMFILIDLGVAVLTLTLFILEVLDMVHEFKSRYPDAKLPRSSVAGKISTAIRVILMALCPVFNLLMLYSLLFRMDYVREKAILNTYNKCINKEGNV